ncbi:hypothetical protein [Sanguibacter sp. HDW7]|uniref:hypothetical protein n=1 Tax=Sanguibacter sp. HDW7 TaxID=2714931 RepID=UPI00140C14CA|nr:hypothetical protein [Sanguibacter sp. HDW7]QIK82645.1 hypothetical protein G7063_02695 [Sanguibacter sp. HDW7]
MNKQETVALIAMLDRAGLTKAREGMEDAWMLVLEPLRAQDVVEAVKRIIATRGDGNTWIVPADVIAEVALVRRERIRAVTTGSLPVPPREIDPDDVGPYMAWVKAFKLALGDGMSLVDAEIAAAHAAGIPPVHRALEEYHGAMPLQIESGRSSETAKRASAAARDAILAILREGAARRAG